MTPSAPEAANVILGTAHRMRFEAIEPFLTSLRATGSRARVCLFASRMDPATLIELRRNAVEVFCFRTPLVRMRNPFAYAWPLLRHLSAPSRPEPLRTAVGRLALNLMDVRFLLYRDYVRVNLPRLRRVLLSDIRDVWFQSDPFMAPLPAGISTFLEDPSIPIRKSPLNAAWIGRAFEFDKGTDTLLHSAWASGQKRAL